MHLPDLALAGFAESGQVVQEQRSEPAAEWPPSRCGRRNGRNHDFKEPVIAKNQNTFAKRQREQEKKRKADDKRARRLVRKDAPPTPADTEQPDTPDTDTDTPGERGT